MRDGCKLIMARVDSSILDMKVCGFPESPKTTAVCAVEVEGYSFSLKMRDECCEAAAKGIEALACKQAVRLVLSGSKQTKSLEEKGLATLALPASPKKPEDCMPGKFTQLQRDDCCSALGEPAVICSRAAEMFEGLTAAAAEIECK